jgi:FixJ family two-component response regulator
MARICGSAVAIIDDDDDVRDSFRFLLEIAGFAVETYPSALAYLEAPGCYPRCLILDQNMPSMSGLELAAQLRAGGSRVPMLLLTESPSEAILARAAAVGVARVLPKPPTDHDLIAFVAAC